MTDTPEAWIWSQYKGVLSEDRQTSAPLPLFGETVSVSGKRTSRGVSLAVAMIVGLLFPKIAFLLLIFAGIMIFSGLEPERFEDFCSQIPGGQFILKLLALTDALIP
jgi:hypothetical protein